MKSYNILLHHKSTLIAIICAFTLWSCSKPVTKSDVQDRVEDAQEATQEAQKETQAALEAREQYSKDDRQARIQELEGRSSDIDNRIKELKKSAKKSSNQAATANIESAIEELQDEKSGLNKKISDVKSIEDEDWSASYEELNQAIGRIEGEISKLSKSLVDSNY